MGRRVGPVRLIDRVSWSPSQPRRAPRLTLGVLFSTSLSSKTVRRVLSDEPPKRRRPKSRWYNDD